MNYAVIWTSRFKKDYKLLMKQGADISLLDDVIRLLSTGATLPEQYRDHALAGNYSDFRECHIKPDWLLIYSLSNDTLILTLSRTGSHSNLFS